MNQEVSSEIEKSIKKAIDEGKFRNADDFQAYLYAQLVNPNPSSFTVDYLQLIREAMASLADSYQHDFWQIENVVYRGKNCTVHLAKEPLPIMTSHEDMIEYSEKAKRHGTFYVGNTQLYHAIFTALYHQRDDPSTKEPTKLMKRSLESKLFGLTEIVMYGRKSSTEIISPHHKIIHNGGGVDEFSYKGNHNLDAGCINKIKSEDPKYDWMKEGKHPDLLVKAIFGTKDRKEIGNVYKWLNGRDNIRLSFIGRSHEGHGEFISLENDKYYKTGLHVEFNSLINCSGGSYPGVRVV